MSSFVRMTATLLLPLALIACEAPPSVQKVIDEAEAKAEADKPRLDNPMQTAAQDEGREVYLRYLLGDWAPKDRCETDRLRWTFSQETFARPGALSDINKPCKLAVVEALDNGSYAVAGFCPRLEQEDEPVVLPITRIGNDQIIIPGVGGGSLARCG